MDRKIDIADRVSCRPVGTDGFDIDPVPAPDGFLRSTDRGKTVVETGLQDQPHQGHEPGSSGQLQVQRGEFCCCSKSSEGFFVLMICAGVVWEPFRV